MSEAILFVGIDLGNEHHALCVVNDVGKVVKERTVKNDFSAFAVLQSLIGDVDVGRVHVAVEDKHNALVDVLVGHGLPVFTINPKQVDRFRERINVAGAKDDRRDARVLASTLRTDGDLYRAVELCAVDVVALQSVSSSLEALEFERRSLSNQLRARVLRSFPTLLVLCPGADDPWFWGLLKLLTSTGCVEAEAVEGLLKAHRKRTLKAPAVLAVITQKRLATAPGVAEATFDATSLLIERLELIDAQRHHVIAARKGLLAKMAGEPQTPSDVDIVSSLPGFGPKTTTTFITRALPARRAGGLNILRALTGAAPVTKRSGKSHVVAMRRACDPRLRDAIFHAAAAASTWDESFKEHYQRLRTAGHGHARALRNIGLRLLRLLDVMLTKRTLYREPLTASATT